MVRETGEIISEARLLSFENGVFTFQRGGEVLAVEHDQPGRSPATLSVLRQFLERYVIGIVPERIPVGSIVRLSSSMVDGNETFAEVVFRGNPLPVPTPIPIATPTPRPTRAPVTVLPSVAGYSTLLAEAASSLPAEYDFVRDGLNTKERDLLDWADSRLFSNLAFLASEWGPDNWSLEVPDQRQRAMLMTEGPLPDSELALASAQGILLLMQEIDIQKKSNGHHVVSWSKDGLDLILDDLELYPGMCVHCYGKAGYDTTEGLKYNYAVILEQGHVHREMLKTFAYLAKADGEGVLVRSLLDNDAEDFSLLYKRRLDKVPNPVGAGSFAYENVSFMSQIELPDGTHQTYPTLVFSMVGNVATEREAVEQVYLYMSRNLIHFTGDLEAFREIFLPYTVTPYSPQLGWILYVGEAGSPSSSAAITGAFRALGLKAEQFLTGRHLFRAGSVEADGETHYYNGNDFLGSESVVDPMFVCEFFTTLEQVQNHTGLVGCAE